MPLGQHPHHAFDTHAAVLSLQLRGLIPQLWGQQWIELPQLK
jgi:hypothetical protein